MALLSCQPFYTLDEVMSNIDTPDVSGQASPCNEWRSVDK